MKVYINEDNHVTENIEITNFVNGIGLNITEKGNPNQTLTKGDRSTLKSIALVQGKESIFKESNLLSDIIKKELSLDAQQEYRGRWRRFEHEGQHIKVLDIISD